MQGRIDAFDKYGGDTTQMLKTKEELEKLGVQVDISLELSPNIADYDIIHLFNVTRIHETYIQCKNAIKNKKPIVFSTIHHSKSDIREYEMNGIGGLFGIIRKFIRNEEMIQLLKTFTYCIKYPSTYKAFLHQLLIGYKRMQKFVLNNSTILLPNSEMELIELIKDFDLEKNREDIIVPNGVEISDEYINITRDEFISKYNLNNFIFCPGRIEPRKNQIALIKALNNTPLILIFAGDINYKHKSYIKNFNSLVEGNENVYYLGKMDRKLLFSAYKASAVTILPSWFETTGLIGLEAGIMGTKVVITQKGYTKEYYGDHVLYCDPSDEKNIRESIINALESNNENEFFLEMIKSKFTWRKAASCTYEAYKKAIAK